MRVILAQNEIKLLFEELRKKGFTYYKLACEVGVSARTVRDWSTGKFSMPGVAYEKLHSLSGLGDLDIKKLPEHWHVQAAAKRGAERRMEIYGNFGTPEGRRKGGIESVKLNKELKTGFKLRKDIKCRRKSARLSEIMGVLFGDGHLSEYQVVITTNRTTDFCHAIFLKQLLEDTFGSKFSLKTRAADNSIAVIGSSRTLVDRLSVLGMPRGNKIKGGLRVPCWINSKRSFQKSFIRGLFDTDGCVYLDKHKKGDKTYSYLGWTITSYSDKLLTGIFEILEDLGYSPTNRKSQKSVFLRKSAEINKYFEDIGTNNPKHRKRYGEFTEEYRSGHNGTVSKTV